MCPYSESGNAERVLPLFCFLVVSFGAGLGISNIPLLLVVEYFPTNSRAEVRYTSRQQS